ncbi:hypothetical protein B0I29_126139 [Actinoplanes lutulentus]|uniref:DUF559 domain-containing protein n=1 Tax=Actinoplanes lutulentus TaxID=1287878 RepID=A0A327YYM6_9ACTN|nr:hypothetical protein B0I29_126139 [Actinoplanes lutulentus]
MLLRTPSDDGSEFEWLLYEQAGVVTTRQAITLLGRAPVERHLRHGRWRSLSHGILLTDNGRLHREQQLWVAILAAGPGALLAGITAATAWGVTGLPSEPIQVIISAERSRSARLARFPADMASVRVYRSAVLPPEHQHTGLPPRTSLGRSVIDAAAWAGTDREAHVVIAAACQQRRVLPSDIRRALDLFPRIRRHRLMSDLLADLAGGASALSEIDLVRLCRQYRLPLPVLQEHRTDSAGRRRYLDAYWPDFRLHVEVDGAHHMDAEQWTADMLRQNAVWIKGDRILRFPASLLRSNPSAVAAQLKAAMTTP